MVRAEPGEISYYTFVYKPFHDRQHGSTCRFWCRIMLH